MQVNLHLTSIHGGLAQQQLSLVKQEAPQMVMLLRLVVVSRGLC